MGFGDLKKKEGLSVLNAYLADKSYIEGLVYLYTFYSFRIKHIFKEGLGGGGCGYTVSFMSSVQAKAAIFLTVMRHVENFLIHD